MAPRPKDPSEFADAIELARGRPIRDVRAKTALQGFCALTMILRPAALRQEGFRFMSAPVDSPSDTGHSSAADQVWSCEELERLYRQALDTFEAAANDLNAATDALSGSDELGGAGEGSAADRSGQGAGNPTSTDHESNPPVGDSDVFGAEQVLEALLFVGGQPLTIKAIGSVLRGEYESGFIEEAIERLRAKYASQNRPYEVRLVDGGYSLVLRPEFEPERNRVYGFGPRQVRLSQETLEVLSLVAYRQPVSRRAVEEIAKRGVGSHLRQLLQRELVILDRGDGSGEAEVTYRTAPRFLQLFGLRRLEELPRIEDLDFK
jgi:segregation and condensation protein B